MDMLSLRLNHSMSSEHKRKGGTVAAATVSSHSLYVASRCFGLHTRGWLNFRGWRPEEPIVDQDIIEILGSSPPMVWGQELLAKELLFLACFIAIQKILSYGVQETMK